MRQREDWWEYTKRIIRSYPALERKVNSIGAQSVTAAYGPAGGHGSTPGRPVEQAVVDRLTDKDAEVWFGTLCRALLGDYADIAAPASADTADVADVAPATADDELEADAQLPVLTPSVAPADDADPQGYKGCLHIKCEVCGEVAAYCVKHPRTKHICQACGAVTPLLDLHKAAFVCKCGNKWVYRTNETDRMIEQACLHCGAPMTAEQDRYGDYWPLR